MDDAKTDMGVLVELAAAAADNNGYQRRNKNKWSFHNIYPYGQYEVPSSPLDWSEILVVLIAVATPTNPCENLPSQNSMNGSESIP